MLIYLIGMPYSGKTTVGRLLADKLNFQFFDLDSLIEQRTQLFIDEIFLRYKETGFRDFETKALKEISKEKLAVVSTGGGIILKKDNREILKRGIVIYLETELEVLEERKKTDLKERPLLKTNSLEKLFLERENFYQETAKFTISNNLGGKEVVDNILKILEVVE